MKITYLIVILLISFIANSLFAVSDKYLMMDSKQKKVLVDEFITAHKLLVDSGSETNGPLLSSFQFKLDMPARIDTTLMLQKIDKLVQDYIALYHKMGINVNVYPARLDSREDLGKAGHHFQGWCNQDFGYNGETYVAHKVGIQIDYETKSDMCKLYNNLYLGHIAVPQNIISPKTALTCFYFIRLTKEYYPSFKDVPKEYIPFSAELSDSVYTSSDKVYQVKFDILPEYIENIDEIQGIKYVWQIYSSSTREVVCSIDAQNGMFIGYQNGIGSYNYSSYEMIYDRYYRVPPKPQIPSDEEKLNLERVFRPLGEIRYQVKMAGPLIREADFYIKPNRPVTPENWEIVKQQARECLESALKLYSFPGKLDEIPKDPDYHIMPIWYRQSQQGFTIVNPKQELYISWDPNEGDWPLAIHMNYIYNQKLKLPDKILTPGSIFAIFTNYYHEPLKLYWDDTKNYNGKTNYYPNQLDSKPVSEEENDISDNNNENSEQDGEYVYPDPTMTLLWYDDPSDDDLNFVLTYKVTQWTSTMMVDAVTGKVLFWQVEKD